MLIIIPTRVNPRKGSEKVSKVESAKSIAQSPHYDPWLGLTDSASYTGRHPQTLREAVRSKELVASRNGDKVHYRIRLSELNRWMRSMETPARKMDPNEKRVKL